MMSDIIDVFAPNTVILHIMGGLEVEEFFITPNDQQTQWITNTAEEDVGSGKPLGFGIIRQELATTFFEGLEAQVQFKSVPDGVFTDLELLCDLIWLLLRVPVHPLLDPPDKC